ncbi:hypothetical protein Gotur_023121 [Gossypium turneri]
MILCKEICPLVGYHRWEHFRTIPKNNVVVPFVQEFYASLQDQEFRNAESHMWELAPVRREEVQKYRSGTNIPTSFHQAIMFPEAKMWIQLVLCKKACVPMTSTKDSLKPSRSIIGNTLFEQYIELCAKQIKDWNKRQQEVTTTPASSQRLTQAQQEVGEGSHPKLEWMNSACKIWGQYFKKFLGKTTSSSPIIHLTCLGQHI